MAVLKPLVKSEVRFRRGWDKAFEINCRALDDAIRKAKEEGRPFMKPVLVFLPDACPEYSGVARVAAVYLWRNREGKVEVRVDLLFALLETRVGGWVSGDGAGFG